MVNSIKIGFLSISVGLTSNKAQLALQATAGKLCLVD
jgi:hypothetical protein